MQQADLRDISRSMGPYRLPPQALPTKYKNKQFIKDTLDQLETIGLRDLEINRERFEDAYRIVEGSYSYAQVADSSLFLSELDNLKGQGDVAEHLEHYGFAEPIINQLVGEYLTEPNPSVIYADDSISTNEYLRTQKEELTNRTMSSIQREIDLKLVRQGLDPAKNDFSSEEEKQAYIQQIQQFREENIPKEVKEFMKSEYKPMYVTWAESTLEQSEVRFNLDEIYRDAFRDYLITGRCFVHWRMGYDYYRPERWSTLETFTSITQDVKYPELGEYVGRIKQMTANQVLTNFGQSLSEKHKRELLRSAHYTPDTLSGSQIYNTKSWVEQGGGTLQMVPHKHHIAYENAGYIQEMTGINLGYTGYFPNQGVTFANNTYRKDDLIQVTEAYWISPKRVGYLTYNNPNTGETIQELVTDEVLKDLINQYNIKQLRTISPEQHFKSPEPNTIMWDYIPEVRYGVKILKDNTDLLEDLYLGGEPLPYQLRGESSTYDTLLPVTGIVENTSLISRIEVDQIEYSLALNMARDYMSKEIGMFFLFDKAYFPEFIADAGGEEAFDKWITITRQLGVAPVDSSAAKGTAFNQFQMVNMDLSKQMLDKYLVAEQIKRRAYAKIGLTPERMGMPTEQKSATGVVMTNDASFAQTGVWFDKFSKFQQRNSEMCINVSQWAQFTGKDVTVNYTDSDLTQHFIKMNDPNLPLRRFRIYPQNNAKRRSELETLRQTYFADNTIMKDLETMAQVVQSDSISNILKAARIGRERKELYDQMAQQQVLQQIEAQKQAKLEENTQLHEYEKEITRLKGEISIREKALVAMGFDPEKDRNSNSTPDVVEQGKLYLAQIDQEFRKATTEEQLRLKQIEMDRKLLLEQEKTNLKREELQVKRELSNNALQVAIKNKNRFDKPTK